MQILHTWLSTSVIWLQRLCSIYANIKSCQTHPRCRTRICRLIPTDDVSTLPQAGHRHLYTPLKEFCRKQSTAHVRRGRQNRHLTSQRTDLRLFSIELLPLFQLHLQAFVGTAVHLSDGWRGGGTHVAVVPAPVAAAAAVGELATTALHVCRGWRSTWGGTDIQILKKQTNKKN